MSISNDTKKGSRLKSGRIIEGVFNTGKVVYSKNKKIKAHYLTSKTNEGDIKFSVAVSKKAGKAVWRNRAKRLIKEAFRSSNSELINYCRTNKILLDIIFTTNTLNEMQSRNIFFKDINPEIDEILHSIGVELKGISNKF